MRQHCFTYIGCENIKKIQSIKSIKNHITSRSTTLLRRLDAANNAAPVNSTLGQQENNMVKKSIHFTLLTLLLVNFTGCGVPAVTVYFKALPTREWQIIEDKDRFVHFDNGDIQINLWTSYLMNALRIRNNDDIKRKIEEDKNNRESLSVYLSISAKATKYKLKLKDIVLQIGNSEYVIRPNGVNLVSKEIVEIHDTQEITLDRRTFRLDYPVYEWANNSFKIIFSEGTILNSNLNLPEITYERKTKRYRAYW